MVPLEKGLPNEIQIDRKFWLSVISFANMNVLFDKIRFDLLSISIAG